MMRIAIGLLVALALSACAFISESQCRSGDWRGIGAGDGERGLGPERWSEFTKACAAYGVQPAQADYEAGRQAGLARYCTPENAFQRGAIGEAQAVRQYAVTSGCTLPFGAPSGMGSLRNLCGRVSSFLPKPSLLLKSLSIANILSPVLRNSSAS